MLELLHEVWTAEAAVLPLDARLPDAAVTELLARARPTVLVDGQRRDRLPAGRPVRDGTALVMSTSGSTGRPRLVELSRDAVSAAVRSSDTRLMGITGLPGADASADGWVSMLPLSHIGGLLVPLRGVVLGAPVVVRDPASVAQRPPPGMVLTSLVPRLLERLLGAPHCGEWYRAVLLGGMAAPAALLALAQLRGLHCIPTYGLTESCGGVVYDGFPLPGTEVRIAAGTSEIELRGPTLLTAYRDGDDAPPVGSDGWLRTGDAGHVDASGALRVDGRLDDVIVTGGDKVWPAAVEAVLRTHPGVADAAVVSRPDAAWGERVVAVVVPDDAASPPQLHALRDAVGAVHGRHVAPRELVVVTHLPRTALGKVAREQVRRLVERGSEGAVWDH